jgi:hypothetical protein
MQSIQTGNLGPRRARLGSADLLDNLPQVNECGLILPKIHLQPLATGVFVRQSGPIDGLSNSKCAAADFRASIRR